MASGFGRGALLASVAIVSVADAGPVWAQSKNFEVPAQSAASGISELGRQADIQIVAARRYTQSKKTNAVRGVMTIDRALDVLLNGTGLVARRTGAQTFTIVPPLSDVPKAQPVAEKTQQAVEEARAPQYEEIIVTAQKKEERITDVPIAMSAFSAETLDAYKIEGGSELLRAVPNIAFSKSNFAGYNFSIRGIGTKALSVTSDPAVAISFNNTPLIRNRLFEQEYFDVERVEVLRGPQGTLYGRNATGGVVNMISNKPKLGEFEAAFKGEVGNYESKRLSGMVNVPIGSNISVRAAGALTKRDGFDYNTVTDKRVNNRDLWSTRISGAWEPSADFRVDLVWEHFNEDDQRSRTGKQLCHTDPGPEKVGGVDISSMMATRGYLSQTCLPKSLYDDGAFGVPNGLSLPHIAIARYLTLGRVGFLPSSAEVKLINPNIDPFAGVTQSKNLREIATDFDPIFRASNDVYQANMKFNVSDNLTLNSQTLYTTDNYYSSQDYNRFPSKAVFGNSKGIYARVAHQYTTALRQYLLPGITPDGIFDDPQLGKSNKILGVDLVRSKSNQFYQEIRGHSELDGPINFNIGANYTNFKIDEDYFVFNNLFTAIAQTQFSSVPIGFPLPVCTNDPLAQPCAYVDPNPLDRINGDGHNYFRSRNVAETDSFAIFGETYWNIKENLKLTAGLRYTSDKKTSTPYKSQLLLAKGLLGGGNFAVGYPESPEISQKWNAVTGRLIIDWKPELAFSKNGMVYGSYSRGYKGGGANPPSIDFGPSLSVYTHPETFAPEYVDAFEVGFKGDFDGTGLSLSANAFYYDYKGYQVSQIVDRLALNENYDATMWGLELEALWRPVKRLTINGNAGYLKTRIKDGMRSIDVMNRTQGNSEYMVLKPWVQLPSSCVVPVSVIEAILLAEDVFGNKLYTDRSAPGTLSGLCGGNGFSTLAPGTPLANYYGVSYDAVLDGPNQGRGFEAELGGNELPNAPRWTFNIGAQYALPLGNWEAVLRADYYQQAKSWSRVYNTEIDRLKSWNNLNISIGLNFPEENFGFNFYVKNLINKTSITDSFINSDDSGLTANVFTLDPRIIGFSVSKSF